MYRDMPRAAKSNATPKLLGKSTTVLGSKVSRRGDASKASAARGISKSDQKLIADFIARNGVKKVYVPQPSQPKIRKCDWALGKRFTPRHRYNLASAYAMQHGLSGPAWTDVTEAELLAMRTAGNSYGNIASALGKTKAAVQMRVRYLSKGRRN